MKFEDIVKEYTKDTASKDIYNINRVLQELSSAINDARINSGMTQTQLANKANITQQQLSKVENGDNCNMNTFIKVALALGLTISLTGLILIDKNVKDFNPQMQVNKKNISSRKK